MYVEAWDTLLSHFTCDADKRKTCELAHFQFMLSEANGNFPEVGKNSQLNLISNQQVGYFRIASPKSFPFEWLIT